jgi:hypothetical protein
VSLSDENLFSVEWLVRARAKLLRYTRDSELGLTFMLKLLIFINELRSVWKT